MSKVILRLALLFCVSSVLALAGRAQQTAAADPIPSAARASYSAFDVNAATDAYLAKVPPDKKARSDAYFEGGYWLILWDFLLSAAILLLLLESGLSARMGDLAEKITARKPLQTVLYFLQFLLLTSILGFPLAVYEGYYREHLYGLATQTFGPWFREQLIGLALSMVFGSLLVTALVGAVRRLERTWWIWGAAISVVFAAFLFLIAPVFIAPLFNKYTKLEDPQIREPILSLARANGIPATEVYQVDTSRQSTRATAYVFGFLGTERIVLGDNLLKATPAEIQSTMGHEMGHYVLNHVYKELFYIAVLLAVTFALLHRCLEWSLRRWGARWGLRGITDVAALPLAALILAVFGILYTPIGNTQTRIQEYEADIFGLNAAQQPDGEAEVDLKLGEYRKLDPGPIEEFLFFDHPSGRTRITAAMRWKKEHLPGAPLAPAAAHR
ncbi:MAG: M48 family metallopeptidase [Acidipila sp.]|nr:M48 family metallopeptidase [Acidipila sp.]